MNRHLKLTLQIKTLKTNVSHQPVRLVRQTGQTGPRLGNRKPILRPVKPVEQTGPTQNLHKQS